MTLAEFERELLKLSPEIRSRLAEVLTASIERRATEVWDDEVERRHQAFLRGELEAVPAKEALAELRSATLK